MRRFPFGSNASLQKICARSFPSRRRWLTLNYGFITKRGRTLSPPASVLMDIVRTIERDVDASQDGGAILETGGRAGPPGGKRMSR